MPRALVILNHLAWVDSFLLSIWLHFNNAVNGDTCWPIYKMYAGLMIDGWDIAGRLTALMGWLRSDA